MKTISLIKIVMTKNVFALQTKKQCVHKKFFHTITWIDQYLKKINSASCLCLFFPPDVTVELEKHMKETEPIFLVDEERVIFATSQEKSGPRTIVHVCKSFNQQVLDCEVECCREFMAMANGKECIHLERVMHLKHQQLRALLQSTSIEDMFQKGLISSSTQRNCLKLNQQAINDRTACVNVFFNEHGFSGRKVNFFVLTSKVNSWAIVGRTRVTLDTANWKWTCHCKSTKKQKCVHIYVAICWTYQERRHLFQDTEMNLSSDTDDDLDN